MAKTKTVTEPPAPTEITLPRPGRRINPVLDRSGGASSSDASGANINVIVAQYLRTGTMPNIQLSNPLYGDHTGPRDLMGARLAIQHAEEVYNELPATIRTASDNDVGRFAQMLESPNERQQLEDAGLLLTLPTETPTLPSEPPSPPALPLPPATPLSPAPPQPAATQTPQAPGHERSE